MKKLTTKFITSLFFILITNSAFATVTYNFEDGQIFTLGNQTTTSILEVVTPGDNPQPFTCYISLVNPNAQPSGSFNICERIFTSSWMKNFGCNFFKEVDGDETVHVCFSGDPYADPDGESTTFYMGFFGSPAMYMTCKQNIADPPSSGCEF